MELQSRLDASLTRFGQSLRSPDEFYREGDQWANKVFEKLKCHSKYSVARVYVGGSFGKKTDVIECVLDLHVVINDFDPSQGFGKVLDDFEDVLILHEDQLEIQRQIRLNWRSLSFQRWNGTKVDLLPASNITDEGELMRKMVKDPKTMSYIYGPSLAPKQIAFMESQSSFTYTLIRLAKFWYMSLYFGKQFKGLGFSPMIEAICAAVAEEEAGFPNLSMFRAFTKVIDNIEKLDTLKLAFAKVAEGRWERVPERDFQRRALIPEIVGTWEILQRKGFVIDPANPFHDFLERSSITVITKLKTFAGITRQRLSHLVEGDFDGDNFISKIFEPLNLTTEPSMRLPYDYYVSYQEPCKSSVCVINVRSVKVLTDPKVKLAVEALKASLLTVVNGAVKGTGDELPMSILHCMHTKVKALLEESLQRSLEPGTSNRHEKMDVTISVPYSTQGQCYTAHLSGKW